MIRVLRAARPALLPFVILLPVAGFGWAHWDAARPLTGAAELGWVMVAWTALHAGTLWLNASRDRDRGPVLFGSGDAPAGLGLATLCSVPPLAYQAGLVPGGLGLACALLAVFYSHPRFGWKSNAVLGPAVNWLGYGLLSPAIGHAVVGPVATPRTWAVALLAATGVTSAYFAAQVFQADEDRRRGDRTVVALYGPSGAAAAARGCLAVAALGGLALAASGYVPRVLLVSAPAWWACDRALRRAGHEASERAVRRALYGMLGAALCALALAAVQYVLDSVGGGPVAGRATMRGTS